MRRTGSRSRSVSVFVLLASSSATLSTTPARADPPSPVAPLAAPPAQPQPIELRQVVLESRYHYIRQVELPFQTGKLLQGADLYRALGREDLARAYETRGGAKVALAIAGLGALVTGAIVMASAKPDTRCDPPSKNVFQPPVCRTGDHQGTVAAGIGIALLGPALMMVAGFAFDLDPVSPAERRRLIAAFNASLSGAGVNVGARF